jgi:hypothetical protein
MRRSKLGGPQVRTLIVVLAGLALALGAVGCGDTSGTGEADQTTTEAAADAPAADSTDTGRMSEGEFDSAKNTVGDLNHEVDDYANKVSERCALILQGAQVAEGLDCINSAYDGVEGQTALTESTLSDLKGDTAKKCRKAVAIAANLVNRPLYQALSASKEALSSLDAGLIAAGIKQLVRERSRWDSASAKMLVLCSPS